MAELSLLEAAQRVNRGKPSLLKAIQSGRLSARRDPETRRWWIDESELTRCYGDASKPMPEKRQDALETAAMERELETLRDTVADLRAERDRLLTLVERQTLLLEPPRREPWWKWWSR